ncbi:APG12-domain-containing protein [Wilcoxina mikolae CBS 423.85]|nr:APG12-domain-containing protein [Wilcoxina mikolae CBS 423.85]KAF8545121.1 ubiquitin-like autophagy protein Apg12-domain-containing protein [Trichophaea hybrida]
MSSTPDIPRIPEDVESTSLDLPITLSASVLLTSLPRDGQRALAQAQHPRPTKVTIKFKAMGSAPVLNKDTYKIKTTQRFENVAVFLRSQLGVGPAESLFLYVNFTFAPALDENVGNLWNSFKTGEELIINYSMQSAFG